MDGVDVKYEQGQFIGKINTLFRVKAGAEVLESDRVYINVGARARIPNINGLEKIPYLTNKSILSLEKLPEHLIIVGGGYVGLEFGQMFRRFGSKVTIIQRQGQLLPREDEDVVEEVTKYFGKKTSKLY